MASWLLIVIFKQLITAVAVMASFTSWEIKNYFILSYSSLTFENRYDIYIYIGEKKISNKKKSDYHQQDKISWWW